MVMYEEGENDVCISVGGRGPYRYLGDQSLRLREHTVQRGYAGMFKEE